MSGKLQQRLDSLKSKAEILTMRYRRIVEEKALADQRIAELEKENQRQEREISELKQRVEHLSVVTTINPTREDAERSRAILVELVRDIDKCISELSE